MKKKFRIIDIEDSPEYPKRAFNSLDLLRVSGDIYHQFTLLEVLETKVLSPEDKIWMISRFGDKELKNKFRQFLGRKEEEIIAASFEAARVALKNTPSQNSVERLAEERNRQIAFVVGELKAQQ